MDLVIVELFSVTSLSIDGINPQYLVTNFSFDDTFKMDRKRTCAYFIFYFIKLVLTSLHDIAINTLTVTKVHE